MGTASIGPSHRPSHADNENARWCSRHRVTLRCARLTLWSSINPRRLSFCLRPLRLALGPPGVRLTSCGVVPARRLGSTGGNLLLACTRILPTRRSAALAVLQLQLTHGRTTYLLNINAQWPRDEPVALLRGEHQVWQRRARRSYPGRRMAPPLTNAFGEALLVPTRAIGLTVFDTSDSPRMSVDAHVLSARQGSRTHKLMVDWAVTLPSIVSYEAGDRWTAAQAVLVEVASRAPELGFSVCRPGNWGRVMLRVPVASTGDVCAYIIDMPEAGDATLWLRGDVHAEQIPVPVLDCRGELDCVSVLALVVDELLDGVPSLLGRHTEP